MKTNLCLGGLGLFIALVLGMFFSSCTKEVATIAPESELSSKLTLKSASVPQPDDMVCDLIAGQSINVGQVVYSHVGNDLLVEYVTTGGWTLSEVHFYVGNMVDFKATCMNKKAIQIGHFPYFLGNLNGSIASFSIPLGDVDPDDEGFFVVAHAVVKNGRQEETAFAKFTHKPIITFKTYFDAAKVDYAVMKGNSVSATPWCSFWGTNVYTEGESYELINEIGEVQGLVSTREKDGNILVTVTPNPPLIMFDKYLFVGSMPNFLTLYSDDFGGCPNWHLFPYKNSNQVSTYTFSVPIPPMENFSFSTLKANRWGWFSYYNL